MERHLPTPFDAKPRYYVRATDRLWDWVYVPIAGVAETLARITGLIQQGRIGVYLTYSFITLLALLLFVR
jgi:hydrogenase-4 component B